MLIDKSKKTNQMYDKYTCTHSTLQYIVSDLTFI